MVDNFDGVMPPIEHTILSHALQGGLSFLLERGITPEMFTDGAFAKIYGALVKNNREGWPCDVSYLQGHLSNDTLAKAALLSCTDSIPTTANLVIYADTIKRVAKMRSYGRKLQEIAEKCKSAHPYDDYPVEEKIIALLGEEHSPMATRCTSGELTEDTIVKIQEDWNSLDRGEEFAIKTGIEPIDKTLGGGLKPKKLITIAGRPGTGKTAIGTNIALNSARNGHKPLYISIELDANEIVERLICTEGGINCAHMSSRQQVGKAERDKLIDAAITLQDRNIFVNCSTGAIWENAVTVIMNAVKFQGVNCVIIDYAQQFRIASEKLTTRLEVKRISSQCKAMAMNLNIPIVLLAQLNREMDKRSGTDKVPLMSDLKESGTLEEDSDTVILLYTEEKEEIENGQWVKRPQIKASVPKNRSGKRGGFDLPADLSINKFY